MNPKQQSFGFKPWHDEGHTIGIGRWRKGKPLVQKNSRSGGGGRRRCKWRPRFPPSPHFSLKNRSRSMPGWWPASHPGGSRAPFHLWFSHPIFCPSPTTKNKPKKPKFYFLLPRVHLSSPNPPPAAHDPRSLPPSSSSSSSSSHPFFFFNPYP